MQNNLDLNTFFKKGVGFGNVDDKLSNGTVTRKFDTKKGGRNKIFASEILSKSSESSLRLHKNQIVAKLLWL